MESPTKTRGRRNCPARKQPKLQNIPSSLKDSPYLSNSIRPITSHIYQDNHVKSPNTFDRSTSSRRSKRTSQNTSNTVNKAKNNNLCDDDKIDHYTITEKGRSISSVHQQQSYQPSNNHFSSSSTSASLRLESPYSESVFSLKSTSPYSSNAGIERKQYLYRSVMLPHEVDDLEDEVLVDTSNLRESGDEDDEYYYSESDESITSDMALSMNDETVFLKLIEMKNSPKRHLSNEEVKFLPPEDMLASICNREKKF